jgi:hypothetical protein
MNPPTGVEELVRIVWDECDPVKVTAAPRYNTDLGLPPKKLHVCESRDVNWDRGYCLTPYTRAWSFDGNSLIEISVDGLPDVTKKNGMYWEIGRIEFAIDTEKKRAVYGYWLGPRYGRGFKKSFDSLDTLSLSVGRESLVWIS